jgi:hypothetical protein
VAVWIAILVFLALMIGMGFAIRTRQGRTHAERHFETGQMHEVDVPHGEHIVGSYRSVTGGERMDTVMIPEPDERTAELLHDETTLAPEDILEPTTPGRETWEEQREAAIRDLRDHPPQPPQAKRHTHAHEEQFDEAAFKDQFKDPPSS